MCRKISMSEFSKLQSFEFEFIVKKQRIERQNSYNNILETDKVSTKTKVNASKLKKSNRNKLFLSLKLANSLKKVRLRKKEKSANNNFLYPKESSLINDEDFKCAKNLPIIPFSPNHLMESNPVKQKHQEIRHDQLNVWNIETRRLENLIREARNELVNERSLDNDLDSDYVDVYDIDNNLDKTNILENNDDYVDMTSLKMHRPRLYSL